MCWGPFGHCWHEKEKTRVRLMTNEPADCKRIELPRIVFGSIGFYELPLVEYEEECCKCGKTRKITMPCIMSEKQYRLLPIKFIDKETKQ